MDDQTEILRIASKALSKALTNAECYLYQSNSTSLQNAAHSINYEPFNKVLLTGLDWNEEFGTDETKWNRWAVEVGVPLFQKLKMECYLCQESVVVDPPTAFYLIGSRSHPICQDCHNELSNKNI